MKYYYFVIILFFAASCSTDKAVLILDNYSTEDESPTHTIIINDKDTVRVSSECDSVLVPTGNVKIQIDDAPYITILHTENGTILNLNKQDYIIYNVRYGSPESNEHLYPFVTLLYLDSMVIWEKLKYSDDNLNVIKKHLPKLLQSNARYITFNKYRDIEEVYYDHDLKYIPDSLVYIRRNWSYGFYEDIPETIKVKTTKGFESLDNTATRKAIMHASTFLIYAMLNSEQYAIYSVEEIMNYETKPEDKAEQLEF